MAYGFPNSSRELNLPSLLVSRVLYKGVGRPVCLLISFCSSREDNRPSLFASRTFRMGDCVLAERLAVGFLPVERLAVGFLPVGRLAVGFLLTPRDFLKISAAVGG